MKTKTYLFFGVGGEYCLHPIFSEMERRQYDCMEIDLEKTKETFSLLRQLKGKEIVFVTSAHLFLNKNNLELEKRSTKEDISPLEIIDYLKPVKKVYYAHDLQDGFNHYDRLHFSLFDLWLSPLPINSHGARFCEVVNVGWIQKVNKVPQYKKGDVISLAHTFSEATFYYSQSPSFLLNQFKEVWTQGVKFKIHNGCTLSPHFIEILSKNKYSFYPLGYSFYDVINENPVIVTNSVTGANIDASLSGRMVINLLDGVYSESRQRAQIGGLPNVHIVTIPEAVEMIKAIKAGDMPIDVGEDILEPFNMELAIKLIVN